ncbi:MAG: protease [Ferruginibacter sp.]|nr:protease [Ferruginibacter sp.]
MKQTFINAALALMLAGAFVSCKKTSNSVDSTGLSQEEKSLVASAGFNSNWVEKTGAGYLIEGDILLTKAQLTEMSGATPTNNFIVGDEEHYHTYNMVSTPSTGARVITVRLTSGFPAYYSTGLDQALARYNSYGLKITFQRVSTGGDIVITASNLGTSGGGCILGQASGFPTSSGNPSSGFTLSNSSCATTYISTADKADEVIAHEMGHCIGFRHTDYKKRASCGPGPGESAGSIGAVYIPGTPTNVSGSYNSWMMACTNGSNSFGADDVIALQYVY